MKFGLLGGIITGVVIIAGITGVVICTERIPTGCVGVVYNMNGGVDGEVLTQGWHIVSPTKKVTEYSISLEQSYLTADDKGDSPGDESFTIPTSDGKTVKIELEFSYKFDSEKISEVFKLFKGKNGDTVKDTFIKPKIMAWTQEVSAKYPVADIFGDKRSELNAELDSYLKAKFKPYGIIIDTANVTNIKTDDETAAAIQKKVNAQQELELAKIQADTAKVQAEKDKQVAMINAEKEKETATLKAEAKKIEADAEAYANKVLSESLTPELLEQQKIEKWQGEVPQVEGGNSSIIDLR